MAGTSLLHKVLGSPFLYTHIWVLANQCCNFNDNMKLLVQDTGPRKGPISAPIAWFCSVMPSKKFCGIKTHTSISHDTPLN